MNSQMRQKSDQVLSWGWRLTDLLGFIGPWGPECTSSPAAKWSCFHLFRVVCCMISLLPCLKVLNITEAHGEAHLFLMVHSLPQAAVGN